MLVSPSASGSRVRPNVRYCKYSAFCYCTIVVLWYYRSTLAGWHMHSGFGLDYTSSGFGSCTNGKGKREKNYSRFVLNPKSLVNRKLLLSLTASYYISTKTVAFLLYHKTFHNREKNHWSHNIFSLELTKTCAAQQIEACPKHFAWRCRKPWQ